MCFFPSLPTSYCLRQLSLPSLPVTVSVTLSFHIQSVVRSQIVGPNPSPPLPSGFSAGHRYHSLRLLTLTGPSICPPPRSQICWELLHCAEPSGLRNCSLLSPPASLTSDSPHSLSCMGSVRNPPSPSAPTLHLVPSPHHPPGCLLAPLHSHGHDLSCPPMAIVPSISPTRLQSPFRRFSLMLHCFPTKRSNDCPEAGYLVSEGGRKEGRFPCSPFWRQRTAKSDHGPFLSFSSTTAQFSTPVQPTPLSTSPRASLMEDIALFSSAGLFPSKVGKKGEKESRAPCEHRKMVLAWLVADPELGPGGTDESDPLPLLGKLTDCGGSEGSR